MRCRAVACCLLLAAVFDARAGAGRVGEAEVRASANGEPCFTISAREERHFGTPDFHAVSVIDPHARQSPLWHMTMPADRTFPVSFSMCIPYGGRVQALPQTPAARLEAGKVYRVRIEARAAHGSIANAYEARFCLAQQPDGTVLVHHIWPDDREGRRLFGCLPPGD
ncbi:MAG: hypothetical protein ACXWC4_23060 [Telluria sp.]